MFRIHIEEEGINAIIRDLTRFEADLENREEPLEEVKERQIARWNRNYMSQGGEYRSWPGNAPSTIRSRQERGYQGWPPLIVEGRMITHFRDQNEEGNVSSSAIDWNMENRPDGDRWLSTVSHHTGYRLGKSRIPSRMLWDLDRQDEDALQNTFEVYLGKIIAEHNLD